MADADEIIAFVESPDLPAGTDVARWKVAVVDDDPAVHEGTRFALYDYALNGQGLEILSAYSAAEGRELLRRHPDTAVVLLDVVMETEEAGLDLVGFIRHELKNETVRIVLRTGQPGQAPERKVIVDYDINDYKAKTELTADRLFTTLTAALRSYSQLQRIVETRRGLEIIIDAASTMFDLGSMRRLAEGVLTQIASLLEVECAGMLVLRENGSGETFSVLAGSGCYRQLGIPDGGTSLDPALRALVRQAFERCCHEFAERRSVLYVKTGSGREIVVLLESAKELSETNRSLIQVYCSRLSIAFDNVILYGQLQDANRRLEERVAKRTAELTAANRRLSQQSDELRRANLFKSEMLGTIAHDLKNPLAVIIGRGEMLADVLAADPPRTDQARVQLTHIRESAKRLTGMVDALIRDAMNDALDITIRREPLDVAALVAEVVEANRPVAERKQQTLTLIGSEEILAKGDYDRLHEAVDNLVSNALKYTPIGGTITVEVRRDAGEAEAVIEVRDSGPGLSPEDVSRLFGRFQRLSAKPTAGESSTGLGLSIAKRIVDLHGGRIAAETNLSGTGATFTIVLPF